MFKKFYIIFLTSVFALAASSDASARNFEKRFDQTLNGGAFSISNVLITCDQADDARCNDAKNFTGPVYQNGPFRMINVDVDSDGTTFNSSSADLALPVDSQIVHAELYWGGEHTDNDAPYKFFLPPDVNKKNEVLFKVPDGNYVAVVGSVDEDGTGFYQGHADVTSLINGSGTYTIANAQLTTGKQMFGGWTLVVVVKSPTEPLRRVVLWDGFLKHTSGSLGVLLPDTLGLRRTESSVAMNLVQYDGDKGNSDLLRVDGQSLVPVNTYPTTDPAPSGDLANSTITRFGTRFEDRDPFYKNTLGYDADLFEIFPFLNSDRDIELEFVTGGDIKHIGVISVQSDIEDRFLQTDWSSGANGTASSLLDTETGFTAKTGHMFNDTVADALHAVQFSYTYNGQQYEVSPVRSNQRDKTYYNNWRSTSSAYPFGECKGTKYWLYREVDKSRVSWFFGAGRRGEARPECNGDLETTYTITGGASLIEADDAGESSLTGTDTKWFGNKTDGHVIRFTGREFKVEGQPIVTTATGLTHKFYLDTADNSVSHPLSSSQVWAFESDFDGRLESKIFDGLVPRQYGTLNFDFTQTNGSVAQVFFRTGTSISDVQNNLSWEGPFDDGDPLGNAVTNNNQFFQYAIVTKLTDPAINTVESEITINEISFDLNDIVSPILDGERGTWTRIDDESPDAFILSDPTRRKLILPNTAVDLDEPFEIDPERAASVGINEELACATSGRTLGWFPLLLLAMFWGRRKRKEA